MKPSLSLGTVELGLLPPLLLAHVLLLLLLLGNPWCPPLAASAQSLLCFDMLSPTVGIYMQEHPAGGMAVVAQQRGSMLLYSLPPVGAQGPPAMQPLGTWLDLSARAFLSSSGETGLLSFAFHPKFLSNGRFFVSYICNSTTVPDCKSACGCSSSVGCTVGSRGAGCVSTTIIAEYSAGRNPRRARSVIPREVRRILSFARPYKNHNGGHIFFGKEGYLYYASGDGGSQGDPWNLAQNRKSFFGKILRLNVNSRSRGRNFSIPSSNPFYWTRGVNSLIYALGLRNPWRCDQDPASGAMACGDVGADLVEEVNVILRGRNYLWHNYEGTLATGLGTPNVSLLLGRASWPAFSYTHASLGGSGCIIGGVFYRGAANPCLQGKYIFSDLSGPMWVANLTLPSPSVSARRVDFTCAPGSPVACPVALANGSNSEWGQVLSWARDRAGNAYTLTTSGIFRVASLARCGITC